MIPRFLPGFPLAYLCVFERAACFNHLTGRRNGAPGLFDPANGKQDFTLRNLRLSLRRDRYISGVNRIKEYICRGDTYQVNFTGKYYFDFKGSRFGFYEDLKNRQSVAYGAFCKFKRDYVISLSPELFFRRQGNFFYSRPMKGTVVRGRDIQQDREAAFKLENSIKDRAENLMIVDLIRNDIGRISRAGSVKVKKLFEVEKYNSLFQMTSTITGLLKGGTTYYDIFRRIFPGGSVTGAPKIRTMQIIMELENTPRNIYCGALGMILPGERAIFNLPIRTLLLSGDKGEMGIGSGIVAESDPQQEFEECLLKARFLTQRYREFRLLETVLWDSKYILLKEHLSRIKETARYFDFTFNRQRISAALKTAADGFKPGLRYKVRLFLNKEGRLFIEHSRIDRRKPGKESYVAISRHPIDPGNGFYYHKTTNRSLYDSEYKRYSSLGYADVLFLNNRQEVTEGAVSNVIIKKGKRYYTPPVSSGLLPGILRGLLIKKGRIEEKVMFLDDLLKADGILLCNSVRGLTEVKLKPGIRLNEV